MLEYNRRVRDLQKDLNSILCFKDDKDIEALIPQLKGLIALYKGLAKKEALKSAKYTLEGYKNSVIDQTAYVKELENDHT